MRNYEVSLIKVQICLLLFMGCAYTAAAQKTATAPGIASMLKEGRFVFVAYRMSPMKGRSRYLTTAYDVRINKDSLVSYLPYIGEADIAPMTSEEAGIQFTSTEFDYTTSTGKRNSWQVKIKFNDQTNTRFFRFTIYDNGNALLDVTSNYRDPISFSGNIRSLKSD